MPRLASSYQVYDAVGYENIRLLSPPCDHLADRNAGGDGMISKRVKSQSPPS